MIFVVLVLLMVAAAVMMFAIGRVTRRVTSPILARALTGAALAVYTITGLIAMAWFAGNDETSTPAIIVIFATPILAASIALLATFNQGYVMLCTQALMFGYVVVFGVFTILDVGLAYLFAAFLLFWGIMFNLGPASRSEHPSGVGRQLPHA